VKSKGKQTDAMMNHLSIESARVVPPEIVILIRRTFERFHDKSALPNQRPTIPRMTIRRYDKSAQRQLGAKTNWRNDKSAQRQIGANVE
jgi:hypothetical protein